MIAFIVPVAILLRIVNAIPIDNGVIGSPVVRCGDTEVEMIFNTEKPFEGRIFVKGMADSLACSQSYKGNAGTSVTFKLGGGNCNMRRTRKLGPQRGVEQSMTVIFSFHNTFITKVDKAYRCTCFFMEADKVVNAALTVSMIPTTDLYDTARMPACSYSVRTGSVTGPVATYTKVGDKLYHVWQCDSTRGGDMFGMKVHSCTVEDGVNSKFEILNEQGCPIDPVILGPLTYNRDLNQAFVEAHAFKFADKINVYFQCAVALCMKAAGSCTGVTPPSCPRTRIGRARFARDVTNLIIEKEVPFVSVLAEIDGVVDGMDVAANPLYILDIDDREVDSGMKDRLAAERESRADSLMESIAENAFFQRHQDVCLSSQGFGLMLTSFLLVTSIAISFAIYMFCRQRNSVAMKA